MAKVKFGVEIEYFVATRGGRQTLPPEGLVPVDESQYLVECRGEPRRSIAEALGEVEGQRLKYQHLLDGTGLQLVKMPYAQLPRDLLLEARRRGSKPPIRWRNLYGYKEHPFKSFQKAGLHLSISSPKVLTEWVDDKQKVTLRVASQLFDWYGFMKGLDEAFKEEIKEAKRRPGFYIIHHGWRAEYRSLPNNVDLGKLVEVVVRLSKEL